MSRYISADARFGVLINSEPVCPLCGKQDSSIKAEWDHKIPFSILPVNESWND